MVVLRQNASRAGAFLTRQLTQWEQRASYARYPSFWAYEGKYLPAIGDLIPGTRKVSQEEMQQIGEAVPYIDEAPDVPFVDTVIDEGEYGVLNFVAGVRFSVQHLNALRKSGKSLANTKMKALNIAMAQTIHQAAAFGRPEYNIEGFMSGADVPTAYVAGYDADNVATTAQDHINFISDQIASIEDTTFNTESATAILIPNKLMHIWMRSPVPGTYGSVLNYVTKELNSVRDDKAPLVIRVINEGSADLLEAFGVLPSGTNRDRLVFATIDPEAMRRKFSGFQVLEPQLDDVSYKVLAVESTTGTMWERPISARYVDIDRVTQPLAP